MDLWLSQLSGRAMGSLFVWIPHMEKYFREAGLEVKRRGVCVGDPEKDWWGEVYENISITMFEYSTNTLLV